MFSSKIRVIFVVLAVGAGISLLILFLRGDFYTPPTESVISPTVAAPTIAPAPASVDRRFEKAVRDAKLQTRADALLPLFDRMPPVAVYVKDEPILKSGTNTETSNAYTFCDKGDLPLIFVKKIYFQTAPATRLENTLKHELTHAWLCRRHQPSEGHGAAFRQKLRAVGGWLNLPKQD